MKKKDFYRNLLFLITISIFCISIIVDINSPNSSINRYIIIYFISIYIFFCIGKSKNLSLPTVFCVYFSLVIALGPIIRIYYNYGVQENILFLINFGFISFIVGYLMPQHKIKNDNNYWLNSNNYKTVWLLCVCLLIISLSAIAIYIYSNRGLLFSGNLEGGRVSALSGNGALIYLGNYWSLAGCLLYELQLKGYKKIKGIWFLILLAAGLEIFTGYRSSIITFFIIVIFMKNKEKTIKTLYLILTFLSLLLFIGGYEVFRSYFSGGTSSTIIESVFNIPNVGYLNLQYIIKGFSSKIYFQNGYSYLINYIMLKPGPDLDFTLWLKQQLGLNFSGGGVTPTIIGEFFLNFGYIGVAIGMFILGCVGKKLQYYYENSSAIYLPSMLIVIFLNSIRGGIANIELELTFNLIVYFIIVYLPKSKKIKT